MKLNQLLENSDVLSEGIRLTEAKSYRLWENAGRALKEAALTPDQIQKLFQQIEQGATDAGGNRTMLGKGKDVASAVNKAWEDLKTKIQDSGPIKNVDSAYDSAVAKIEAGLGGPDNAVNQVIQKYRAFAKAHPIAQGLIYSALIAAAGISGAGLGGAAVLGLLKMTDKLLQGEKFSSAAYQGGKTGAMAYAAGQIGKAMRGDQAPNGAGNGSEVPADIQKGLASDQAFQDSMLKKFPTTDGYTYSSSGDSLQVFDSTGRKVFTGDIPLKTMDMKQFADLTNNGQMATPGITSGSISGDPMAGVRDAGTSSRGNSGWSSMKQTNPDGTPYSLDQVNAVKAAQKAGNISSVTDPTDMKYVPRTGTIQAGQGAGNTIDFGGDMVPKAGNISSVPAPTGGNQLAFDKEWAAANLDQDAAQNLASAASAPPQGAGMTADYLKKVISGETPRPMISAQKAQAALDWQAQNGGQLQQAANTASSASSGFDPEYLKKVISGETPRPMISKEKAQALLNQMSGSNLKEQGIRLREAQILRLFRIMDGLPVNEGMWDTIKGAAGNAVGAVTNKVSTIGKNLTTKTTADKLTSAWKSAGSPTDSEEVKAFLQQQGVDATIIDPAMKAVGVTSTPTPAADPSGKVDPTLDPAASTPAAAGGTPAAKAGKVGVPAGKAAVDQAVNSINAVRGDRRQQVVQYAQTKFSGIKEEKFHSRFLGMDI